MSWYLVSVHAGPQSTAKSSAADQLGLAELRLVSGLDIGGNDLHSTTVGLAWVV
jgi:hypothetical protein